MTINQIIRECVAIDKAERRIKSRNDARKALSLYAISQCQIDMIQDSCAINECVNLADFFQVEMN